MIGFLKRSSCNSQSHTQPQLSESHSQNSLSEPRRQFCSEVDLKAVKKNMLYVANELTNKDFLDRIQKTNVDVMHLQVDQQLLKQQGTLRNLINLSAVKIKDLSQIIKALND